MTKLLVVLFISSTAGFSSPLGRQIQRLIDDDSFFSETNLKKPKKYAEQFYITVSPVLISTNIEDETSGSASLDLGLGKGIEASISGYTKSDTLGHINTYFQFGFYDREFSDQAGSGLSSTKYENFDIRSVWMFGKRWRIGNGLGFERKGGLIRGTGSNLSFEKSNVPYLIFLGNYQSKLSSRLYYKIEAQVNYQFSKSLKSNNSFNSALNYSFETKLAQKIQDLIYSFSLKYSLKDISTNNVNANQSDLGITLGVSFSV